MNVEHNLDLVHKMYEALNSQDLDEHDEYWSEDMIWHGPPGWGDILGREAFKYKLMEPFYKIFPDYHVVNEIEVADENWVAATGILTGTHQGDWLGVPATGKPVTMRFSDFWLVRDGKLAENWVMVDNIAVLHQIGACTLDWKYVDEIKRSEENKKTFDSVVNKNGSTAENLDLVKKMCDALVAPEHDLEAQKEFWKEDMIWHGPPGFGEIHSIEGFLRDELSVFYEAFPDFNGDFDIFFANENWVAATGFVTGTHEGDWLGISATGKPVKMRYSDIWLIRDGRLSENWVMLDHMSVLDQMGVNPIVKNFNS